MKDLFDKKYLTGIAGTSSAAMAKMIINRIGRSQHDQGVPLDETTRTEMEQVLGYKLDHVRLYSDEETGTISGKLNADAFTVGSNVFIPEEKLHANTGESKGLLAHELTHVIQQTQPSAVVPDELENAGTKKIGESTDISGNRPEYPDLVHKPAIQYSISSGVQNTGNSAAASSENTAMAVERSVTSNTRSNNRQGEENAIDPEEIADKVYQLMQQELWLEKDRLRR